MNGSKDRLVETSESKVVRNRRPNSGGLKAAEGFLRMIVSLRYWKALIPRGVHQGQAWSPPAHTFSFGVSRIFLLLLLSAVFASAPALAGTNDSLIFGFEARVACQTTIEEIRWSHRIWPEENTAPKPSFSEVLSNAQIQAKVEESLRMEAVLQEEYGVQINSAMLQVELDRMARNTKAPERLQELFDALGNNPVTIAECLARPTLVRSKLYNHYVWDDRRHGALRAWAEEALAHYDGDSSILERSGGEQHRQVLERKDEAAEWRSRAPGKTENDDGIQHVALDSEAFEREVARLTGNRGNQAIAISAPNPGLLETETAFVYTEVLSRIEDRLEVNRLVWQKQGFGLWWQTRTSDVGEMIQQNETSHLILPVITGTAGHWAPDKLAPVAADSWVTHDAPTARHRHTAIWSGTEMIVWGGYDGSYTNTGSRYDPSIDIWTATTTVGAPDGRDRHTTIWNGTAMIVWGGYDGSSLNTGGRYDPSIDSWTASSTIWAPSGRRYHTAIWSGTEMIIWGGHDGSLINTGGRYDPSSDSWIATTTVGAPGGRIYHTAIWSGKEMIVWGGGATLNTGGRYDPSSDSWIATTTDGAPSGRQGHTVIWSGTEMIVWGGNDGSFTNTTYFNTGSRYNPSTDSWTATTTSVAPSRRSGHTAIWTGTEMIVWGGYLLYPPDPYTYYNDTGGRYDPSIDIWTNTTTTGAPSERSGHTAIWTGTEMIVWGGYYGSYLNTGGRYDPSIDSWTASSTIWAPSGRIGHTAIWSGTEMIIWGGYDGSYFGIGGLYFPYSYTITVNVTGQGSVTSNPPGIDCGTDCTEAYPLATVVNLFADPNADSAFVGWSGDPDCADGTVTMDGDRNCTATFDLLPDLLFEDGFESGNTLAWSNTVP